MIFLIPARSGSKRIKNKNILRFKNKTLLDFTLDLFENSNLKKFVYVSTNSRKIISNCKKRKTKFILRPYKISRDRSLVEDAMIHFLKKKKNELKNKKWLVLLQITSPLRNKKVLKRFSKYLMLQNKNINTVISVTKTKKDFWKEYKGKLIRLSPSAPRREQERNEIYEENGLFYAVKIDYFLKHKKIVSGNVRKFITPKEISLDINDKFDLKLFKFLISKK